MLLSQICRRRSTQSRKASAWIVTTSLGAVLVTIGLQLAFGKSVYSQALLYSAFPLAVVASDHINRARDTRSHVTRGLQLLLALSAMYAFFLGMTAIASWI